MERVAGRQEFAFDNVSVVDVESGEVRRRQMVQVRDGRITSIEPGGSSEDVRAVPGDGAYLIPGLWDMHAHALYADNWPWAALLMVANGVTGYRDMATSRPRAETTAIRADAHAGRIIAPRFLTGGPLIDGAPPIFDEFVSVSSAAETRAVIASLHDEGVDFIKIYTRLDRDCFYAAADEATRRGLPFVGHVPLSVTVAEASDAGMKSVEHSYRHRAACCPAETEIRSMLQEQIAAQAAQDWTRATRLEDSALRLGLEYSDSVCGLLGERLARNGTWFVPTAVEMRSRFRPEITVADRSPIGELFDDPRLEFFPPRWVTAWRDQIATERGYQFGRVNYSEDPDQTLEDIEATRAQEIENRLRMTGDLHRAGVGILAGTDASANFPLVMLGFSLHEELELMVASGLSPLEALRTATVNPAKFMEATDRFGSVSVGKEADLVLLDGNPLDDIRNTARIRGVTLQGRYFDRDALDGLLRQAGDLARSA